MTDVSTGAGEPSRTLALLWRDAEGIHSERAERRRGPGRSLSVDAVVDAGLALADADGLAAVTMRAVARHVGVSTMSVYTYVPGKAELLDLMHDAVLGELPTDYRAHGDWRSATEASVRDVWALYERHPWMLHIAGGRN